MTKQEVTLYRTDGTKEDITPHNNGKLSYETLTAAVGGMVEMVPLPSGNIMIINEEGKLIGLPENAQAIEIWKKEYPIEQYPHNNDELVVGNAIICPAYYVRDDE